MQRLGTTTRRCICCLFLCIKGWRHRPKKARQLLPPYLRYERSSLKYGSFFGVHIFATLSLNTVLNSAEWVF